MAFDTSCDTHDLVSECGILHQFLVLRIVLQNWEELSIQRMFRDATKFALTFLWVSATNTHKVKAVERPNAQCFHKAKCLFNKIDIGLMDEHVHSNENPACCQLSNCRCCLLECSFSTDDFVYFSSRAIKRNRNFKVCGIVRQPRDHIVAQQKTVSTHKDFESLGVNTVYDFECVWASEKFTTGKGNSWNIIFPRHRCKIIYEPFKLFGSHLIAERFSRISVTVSARQVTPLCRGNHEYVLNNVHLEMRLDRFRVIWCPSINTKDTITV